jgi:excisionase family DNA binding protein
MHATQVTPCDDLPTRIEQCEGALNVAQICMFLGKKKATIYQMCKDGRIPHYRIDGSICFDPFVIAAWLRSKAVPMAA